MYFDFDGFYDLHKRLLSKIAFADEKKSRFFILIKDGFFFPNKNKIKIKIIDDIDKDEKFNYLRPKGRLILRMDSIYNLPKTDILFNDWYTNSVKLWPKTEKADKQFLRIERTPINSPSESDNTFSLRYCSLKK